MVAVHFETINILYCIPFVQSSIEWIDQAVMYQCTKFEVSHSNKPASSSEQLKVYLAV